MHIKGMGYCLHSFVARTTNYLYSEQYGSVIWTVSDIQFSVAYFEKKLFCKSEVRQLLLYLINHIHFPPTIKENINCISKAGCQSLC